MSKLLDNFAPTIIAALLAVVGTLIVGAMVFYETSMSNDRIMEAQIARLKYELEAVIAREAMLRAKVSDLDADVKVLNALTQGAQRPR